MKKQLNKKLAWPIGIFAAGVVLLIIVAGCIQISVKVTESQTSLPGHETTPGGSPFPPSGGNFIPGQGTPTDAGTGATICNHPVTKKVVFTFTLPNGQTYYTNVAPGGTKGFKGTIIDMDNNNLPISNNDFYLYLFSSALRKNCCTNVFMDPNQIGTNVWAGYGYTFTAYFIAQHEPPAGHRLKVDGNWTQ